MNVTEVAGMVSDTITLQDIFVLEQVGYEDGKEIGRLKATGVIPKFIKRFHDAGIDVPVTMFTAR